MRSKPKLNSRSETWVAGVGMPGAEALGELSTVDMEPWWSDLVLRLYSLEDLRCWGWSGLNSTVEETGLRRTVFSLT